MVELSLQRIRFRGIVLHCNHNKQTQEIGIYILSISFTNSRDQRARVEITPRPNFLSIPTLREYIDLFLKKRKITFLFIFNSQAGNKSLETTVCDADTNRWAILHLRRDFFFKELVTLWTTLFLQIQLYWLLN